MTSTGPTEVRAFNHHWDYITDFLYFEDKKQLLTTSSVPGSSCLPSASASAVGPSDVDMKL